MAALLHARCVEAARQFGEAASHGSELAKKEIGATRWWHYVERGEGRQRGGKWGQEGAGRSVGVPTGEAKPTRGGETDGGAASQAPAKLELEEG